MFALVEPYILNDICDRPDLGCAMLIAACKKEGIATRLVKGQTRYIKDMFLYDGDELWELINDSEDLRIAEYKRNVQKKGKKQFIDELKILYRNVILNKNPRNYLDIHMARKFYDLYRVHMYIYRHRALYLNSAKLKIIDNYISKILRTKPRYIGFSVNEILGIPT